MFEVVCVMFCLSLWTLYHRRYYIPIPTNCSVAAVDSLSWDDRAVLAQITESAYMSHSVITFIVSFSHDIDLLLTVFNITSTTLAHYRLYVASTRSKILTLLKISSFIKVLQWNSLSTRLLASFWSLSEHLSSYSYWHCCHRVSI